MTPYRLRGSVTVWKDDRGFGFIQPNGGGEMVFLHISALPRYARRPQVGDTVDFRVETAADGKRRAIDAMIAALEPVAPPERPRRESPVRSGRRESPVRSVRREIGAVVFPLALVAMLIGGIAQCGRSRGGSAARDFPPPQRFTASVGNVKGNISYTTGERLYHVPGMRDYEITEIDTSRGERWFRTEAEAQAAGWRRADLR